MGSMASGEISIVGGASKRLYTLRETSSQVVEFVDEVSGKTLLKLDEANNKTVGVSGVELESHASRHGYGKEDPIPDESLRFKQIDKVFKAGASVTVSAGGTYTIPKGVYYVFCGPNTSVEVYDDVAGAWKTVIAAGGAGLVISDGSNVRLYNSGSADETSNLREIE